MNCQCKAKLKECDCNNKLCPASSYRLAYDTEQAMAELYDFAKNDVGSVDVLFSAPISRSEWGG